MKASQLFKKANYFKMLVKADSPELHQSRLEELALNFKFERCKKTMAKSYGFVHPIEDHLTENGISYVLKDWFIFTVQVESRKVSTSEVNFEVQTIAREIEKTDHRKITSQEKKELKEKIYEEKLKDAPSTFSRVNFAFNKSGDLIVNTSSDKALEPVLALIEKSFSEYFGDAMTGFANSMPIATTNLFATNNQEMPSSINLEVGQKGEGKNIGKKFTFNKIDSHDDNIVSMIKNHSLSIHKIEFHTPYKGEYATIYTSNKGVEKIDISDELEEVLANDFEDSQMENEEDYQIEFTLELICQFYQELFAFIKKLHPESGNFEGLIDHKLTTKEEMDKLTQSK